MGTSLPVPKKGAAPPPQFSVHVYCGQTAGCIKMPLGMEIGLSPGVFVLDGVTAPFSKRWAEPPNFRPMFIVAKRLDGSRWQLIWRQASAEATLCKMGTQSPPQKGGGAPSSIFGPCLLWPNCWMHQDISWYGGRPQPRGLCVRW